MKLTLKQGNTLVSALLVLVMMFAIMPATQPVMANTTCDWVQFVADITVPDGTYFNAGATFNKTWRLKNIGTCTWTTGYSLVFVDGTQMGAPASVNLPANVAPGGTVDLTVAMTAPTTAGTYRGNWQLKNASGVRFGIGYAANSSFWVEVKVAGTSGGTGTGYDFVANAGSAVWSSGAGTLPFPGTDGDVNGFAKKLDAPVLENGTTGAAGLLTAPQNVYYGYIQGQYPAVTIKSGDRFQSIINCEYNATACYVNFRLNYQIGDGAVQTLWSFNERYEGLYYNANIDLSFLAGQSVKFILYVGAAGYGSGDRAVWGAPRITGSGGVTPTATPGGPTVTPSPTSAGTSSCDRATFISDVNVPDGTVFTPNTAFTKTWRIKNVGTCTWTTGYSLVFVSGNQMGGPATVNLTSTVGPNTSFDVSVALTAPGTAGSYRGYWQFKNASGQLFGIGYYADKPWWVDIVVSGTAVATATKTPGSGLVTPTVTNTPSAPTVTPNPAPGTVYDFNTQAASATWSNNDGALTFPGTDPSDSGFARTITGAKLEDGSTESRTGLQMVPKNTADGYVKGVFPAYTVQTGDRFQATISCQFGSNDCYVRYVLDYQIDSNPVVNLIDYTERYEGLTRNVDIDLAALAGKNVKFILAIYATNGTLGAVDRALWIAPRVVH